jgi:electron transport complex protein RnfG
MAKESNFKNMVIALFAVTFVASASLGVVNEFTKGAIMKANIDAQNKAVAAVLPPFEKLGASYKVLTEGETDSLELFPALDKDSLTIATAVKSYTKRGFSGLFTVMVGISAEGTITGYNVLEHHETPGLGSKMALWFSNKDKPNQYVIGKNPGTDNLKVAKDGGSVDAITAATISSRAFLESVQRAYNAWKSHSEKQNNGAIQKGAIKEGTNS